MGGKSAPGMPVALYHMSVHLGVCLQADAVTRIVVGDKIAWSGDVSANTTLNVRKLDLFGGPKKEGGVFGRVDVLLGAENQVFPEALAYRFGRASATMPAYRGITTLFFRGAEDPPEPESTPSFFVRPSSQDDHGISYEQNGFYWSANSPYVKSVSVTVRRSAKGLSSGIAMSGPNANLIHCIYEAITDPAYGYALGTLTDTDSFEEAAAIAAEEGLFGSLTWAQQTSIEDFVGDLLAHVEGMIFTHPRTGLLTIRLTRGGYDVDTLREVNPDNARLSSFQRKGWGETINEIAVTWTNPENEQESLVTIQDLANIEMQGDVVPDSRNYYAIRSADLAMKLAARDLRAASAPLCSCSVELDRSWWDITPGEVVKLSWPQYGIESLPMRVGPVDYGQTGSSKIKASLLEDVFGYEATEYVSPPSTSWEDPDEIPAAMTHAEIVTLPYYLMEILLGAINAKQIEYPEVMAGFLAAKPGKDTKGYDLLVETVDALGAPMFASFGTRNAVGWAQLSAALEPEAHSTLTEFENLVGVSPRVTDLLLIGTGEGEAELCMILSTTGANVRRGLADTIPRAWPIGTPVWVIPQSAVFHSDAIYSDGETLTAKFLTRTSAGRLDEEDAPEVTGELTGRPHLPLRPANVKVDGVLFENLYLGRGPDFTLTWSLRNRFSESTPPLAWDAAGVPPEDGARTFIRVLEAEGVDSIVEHNAPEGDESFVFTRDDLAGRDGADIEITALRSGHASLQKIIYRVRGVYLDETLAIIDAFLTPVDVYRERAINDFVVAAKAAGAWSKLDGLWMLAGHDEVDARLNWKTPGTYTLTKNGSPLFVEDQGVSGDSISAYYDTNYIPGSGLFSIGSAHLGYWARSVGELAQSGDFGSGSAAPNAEFITSSTGVQRTRLNGSVQAVWAAAPPLQGHYCISRKSSESSYGKYKNGVLVGLETPSFTGVPTSSFRILSAGGVRGTSANQVSVAHVGSGLNSLEAAAFYQAINAYLVAIGAA